MAQAHILVVEDQPIVAKDIESKLIQLGYTVAGIVNSRETALQRVAETQPDLILIDIRLGNSAEGVEAAEQIHARFRIPVVCLTAPVNDETQALAQRAQPYDLVSEPFETLELHSTIEMALSRRRLQVGQKESNAAPQALQTSEERYRNEQALQRHARRLETLHEINVAVLAGQSSEAITKVTLRHVCQLLPCAQASVVLFDYEAGHASVLTSHSTGESAWRGSKLSLESFNVSAMLRERGPVTIDDVLDFDSPSPVIQTMRAEGLRSIIMVPLAVQNHLIGSLNIAARSPGAYSAEDAEIVRQVADHLAIAIEQTQLREEVQLHMENLEALVRERTTDLQAALERVQSADRLKSEFVSNVSHELRTPLTNIKLYLTLMTRGKREKRRSYLDTLRRETDRLQDLIESILDLSRLDLGRTRALLEPTDVNLLMGTLVADRAALVTDRGLELDVEPSPQLPLALADARLLEQVLTNLLTNAVNYTPAGGQIRLFTGSLEAEGQRWITVSVADSGPGIPDQERPRLFERFYRGSAGRASDAPGTGLGLAICREIMDRHGGHITLDSAVGQGSTFTISLRVAEAMP